jgi:hypothetical protein
MCPRYLNAEKEISAVWEQCCVAAELYEWIETFKNGHTNIKHEERAGPATEGNGACMACLSVQNFSF